MSAMKQAECECREVMEELLAGGPLLDEDVLGRNLYVAIGNVQHYRDLIVTSRDPANQKYFAEQLDWREQRAIETILDMKVA